jgi:hypothetical protein
MYFWWIWKWATSNDQVGKKQAQIFTQLDYHDFTVWNIEIIYAHRFIFISPNQQ